MSIVVAVMLRQACNVCYDVCPVACPWSTTTSRIDAELQYSIDSTGSTWQLLRSFSYAEHTRSSII